MQSSNSVWRPATVLRVTPAADDIMSLELKPESWIPHKAGQHYELRLPGHHLSRKYSIVSSPDDSSRLEFGIQLLPYGEVSPKLWRLRSGDALEIRGPLGAFTWTPDMAGPLVMVAAGSGVTPFLAMYEQYVAANPGGEAVLILSAKHQGRVMHYDRYKGKITTRFTATDGRIDAAFLRPLVAPFLGDPTAHFLTCGPGGFTGTIIDMLMSFGAPEAQIRRETFN